jgi:hypothetical protein
MSRCEWIRKNNYASARALHESIKPTTPLEMAREGPSQSIRFNPDLNEFPYS